MLTLLWPAWFAQQAQAVSPDIVISQVYGGGGNSGATFRNDFIALFNRGTSAVDVTGWSVQYASSTGTSWQKTDLAGTIPPGQYYLIQEAAGTGGTVDLPTPNATGSIAMSATAGKVALVNTTTALTGSCPSTDIVDFVGYGTAANCFEGNPSGNLSNTTAALRIANGATDTDNNGADFAIGAPNPRNMPPPDAAPSVSSTVPADNASNVPLSSNITITFSEPVHVTGAWFALSCSASGVHSATVAGGPMVFTLDPDTDFIDGDICTLTVFASQVTDQDNNDPPNDIAMNFTAGFSTGDACLAPYTHIYSIQGSDLTAAITGPVMTQGVVVGDYEEPSGANQIRGFYLQDLTDDGDAATSDGIFVFNGNNTDVNLGDVIRVSGVAGEFQDQTQIGSVSSIVHCGTGSVAPVDVTLPFPSADYLERYEGMLVRLPQTLFVTEHFHLGRFGQVVMSSEERLPQPTNVVPPGPAALALQAANDLNRIIIDDASNSQNPDPILFGRGGNPLSASNTLRGGDTATGIVGVMTYTWAGNAASGNAYRVRPIHALDGYVDFVAANPRPVAPPAVGGALKVVGMNLLNFFHTFESCTLGVDGDPTDCRGANTAEEFDRQWPKTVAAILAMDADIIGVNEIENDGYDSSSAIQFLVDQLNAASAPGTYAFIDVDAATGQENALGTDAIKVGLLYRPAAVTPVGQTAALNTEAFVNGGDSAPRSRPSLAQAFEQNSNRARFIVNLNHLKSKGSACDDPDAGDGQGNCNGVRVQAAHELMAWLAADPTRTGERDILMIGDYNSYAMEEPIKVIKEAGFTNLIESRVGEDAYSYVFDGQWGYLDHALASPSLLRQVTGVGEYHINADEPSVLDYNTDFKTENLITTLYAPDQFRVSDHDPIIVGLTLKSSFSFYLRGAGGTANPPTLFLQSTAPTTLTEKYKDSTSLQFRGGNPWKEVGTWAATPTLAQGTLRYLRAMHTWLGLKNSDDQGTRFDVRVDVYKNGALVASGISYCITGVARNPALAKRVHIPLGSAHGAPFNGTTDVLSLKVLTRIGTHGAGGFCGGRSNAAGLRLYFDARDRPSSFHATFGP
jgi:predicted extracellular nuclease